MYNYLKPVKIEVSLKTATTIRIPVYTAKLVKTLLINGNPELEALFSKEKTFPPKPFHITPLYKGVRALYPHVVAKGRDARPPTKVFKPVVVKAGEEYIFYIGCTLDLLKDILSSLMVIDEFEFKGEKVVVSHLSYRVQEVDVKREVEALTNSFLHAKKLKVTFLSPSLFKDPLVLMRKKKKKLLLPLPEAVLSVPLLMTLISRGIYRTSLYLRAIRYLKSVLDIPYTVLKTVNLVWYVYDNNPLPALIGYVIYFVDYEMLNHVQMMMSMKYGLDFLELFAKAMVLAQVYGVGDGRTAGFGHVSITNC